MKETNKPGLSVPKTTPFVLPWPFLPRVKSFPYEYVLRALPSKCNLDEQQVKGSFPQVVHCNQRPQVGGDNNAYGYSPIQHTRWHAILPSLYPDLSSLFLSHSASHVSPAPTPEATGAGRCCRSWGWRHFDSDRSRDNRSVGRIVW